MAIKSMTYNQWYDIIASTIGAIPNLSFDQAQIIINNHKRSLFAAINEAFKQYAGSINENPSTEFVINDRIYELADFRNQNDDLDHFRGQHMITRARELHFNLGEEDGLFIMEHQEEIPQWFRENFYLVFTDWEVPYHYAYEKLYTVLWWDGNVWRTDERWPIEICHENDRLVRRRM